MKLSGPSAQVGRVTRQMDPWTTSRSATTTAAEVPARTGDPVLTTVALTEPAKGTSSGGGADARSGGDGVSGGAASGTVAHDVSP